MPRRVRLLFLAVCCIPVAGRAAPATVPVQVMNPSSRAVPVTVMNPSTTTSVSGAVTVSNDAARPVPVLVLRRSAEIVQFVVELPAGPTPSTYITLFSQKALLVEQVSAHCSAPATVAVSEPGGNDSPDVTSRAPLPTDHFVVTGQTIWIPVTTELPGQTGAFSATTAVRILVNSPFQVAIAFAAAQPPGSSCSVNVFARPVE
jgi:hypothetical protein